ncbi:hypothetical protein ACF0H5_006952 [Mactra antiquata]
MKLVTLLIHLMLICMARTIYIPHPNNPDVLVPVVLDETRPQVHFDHVFVEQAPETSRLLSLFYLLFTIPFMFSALNKATGSTMGTSGSGGGLTVVTGSPCCNN